MLFGAIHEITCDLKKTIDWTFNEMIWMTVVSDTNQKNGLSLCWDVIAAQNEAVYLINVIRMNIQQGQSYKRAFSQ